MYYPKKQFVSSLLPVVLALVTAGMFVSTANAQDANALRAYQVSRPFSFGDANIHTVYFPAGKSSISVFGGTVPAGKRFVIERVTGFVSLDNGQRLLSIGLQTKLDYSGYAGPGLSQTCLHVLSFPTPQTPGQIVAYNLDLTRRFYADPLIPGTCGENICFNITRADSTKASSVWGEITLSGYLVDLVPPTTALTSATTTERSTNTVANRNRPEAIGDFKSDNDFNLAGGNKRPVMVADNWMRKSLTQ